MVCCQYAVRISLYWPVNPWCTLAHVPVYNSAEAKPWAESYPGVSWGPAVMRGVSTEDKPQRWRRSGRRGTGHMRASAGPAARAAPTGSEGPCLLDSIKGVCQGVARRGFASGAR